jgi:acetyl esterase/lipase
MGSRLTPGWRTLVLTALCGAPPVLAQGPITYDSLAALRAPAPSARIVYGTRALQFGNLRLPRGPGPHPVVLFVHGGCFLQQYTIAHAAALEQAFADSGYAVWSIEYRRVGDEGGGWPGTFEDVARAADYLRVLARTYPLDLSRVVAAGHSAGGALVMWLASRDRLRADSPLRGSSPIQIGAVLAIAPAADFGDLQAKRVCGGVMDKLMGGSPDSFPERYRDVSPALLAPIQVPQIIVVGGQDRNWGPGGKAYYASALAARDSLVRMVEVPEAGHFDVVAPTTAAWAVVMQALRDSFGRIGPR